MKKQSRTAHRQQARPVGSEPCVRCEVSAWQWAIRVARQWTPRMATQLAFSLATYRTYARTDEEQRALDELCGRGGYRVARLIRAAEGVCL